MSLSFWQILLVVLLMLLLFGRGRITHLMGDLAGGIKSFKKGLREEEAEIGSSAPSEVNRSSESHKS